MIYDCHNCGCGQQGFVGTFRLTRTSKKLTFSRIPANDDHFSVDDSRVKDRLDLNVDHKWRNAWTEWSDGDFTVYPNRDGNPYVLNKIADA